MSGLIEKVQDAVRAGSPFHNDRTYLLDSEARAAITETLRAAHKYAMSVGGAPGYRVIEDFASDHGVKLHD
jgi:putative AlgH/UPF0301 family transcriptional regulator